MNKKPIFLAMLVGLLALSLAFVSCDNGTSPVPVLLPPGTGPGGGEDPADSILDALGLDREKIREIGLDTSALAGAQSGDYVMIWGAFNATVSEVSYVIGLQGWSVTQTSADSCYATGTTAVTMLNYCVNNIYFGDGGGSTDTWEHLLEYQANGGGLSSDLKSALIDQSESVPILGVFKNVSGYITAFFVDQID